MADFIDEGMRPIPAADAPPERDEDHHLTRAGMEHVLAQGGSVKFDTPAGPRLATHHEHLPTEADLAGDDDRKRAVARGSLLSQQAAISAELAKIGKGESPRPIVPEPSGENPEVARLRAALDKERADRQAADKAALDADKARSAAEKACREAEAKLADASKATPAPNVAPAPSPAPATNAPPKDKAK